MATEGLRKFLNKEIKPQLEAHGEGHFSKEQLQGRHQSLAEFGLVCAPHPEEFGGLGMDWVTHLLLWEEVAVVSLDLAMPPSLM
nr:acyl-CoA dehydrogenase family protein [Colwellia maritima]